MDLDYKDIKTLFLDVGNTLISMVSDLLTLARRFIPRPLSA